MEGPTAKRQRTKREAVISSESDLQIIVEDETFRVHSLILKMVSPVFLQMLTSDMCEGLQKQVTLTGKKKRRVH